MIRRDPASLALLYGAILAIGGWLATGAPFWIGVGGVLVGLRVVANARARRERGGGRAAAATLLLVAAVISSFLAHHQLETLADEWPERAAEREVRVQSALADALDALLLTGEASAERLSRWWEEEGGGPRPVLPAELRTEGIDALAVFGPRGDLLAWDGTHQGPVADEVRRGASRYFYREGALFGYLYVTLPLQDGGTAMAAALLRADLPPALESPPRAFTARFQEATGAEIQIARADRVVGESVWDLRWDDEVLFSVTLAPAEEAAKRAVLEVRWGRWIAFLLLAGWTLGIVAGRGRLGLSLMGGGSLMALLLLLPLGRLLGEWVVFSPADLLLPGPLALTLGDLLALGAGGAVVLGIVPGRLVPRLPPLQAALAAILASVGLLALLSAGISAEFVTGPEAGWIMLQGVAVALLLLPMATASLLASRPEGRPGRPLAAAGALILAIVLAVLYVVLIRRGPGAPLLFAVLWVVPFWLLLRALPGTRGWPAASLRWLGCGVMAAMLTLPWAWGERLEARITVAEERVERLGTRPDPFLEFLLLRASEEARALATTGRDPVEVLYGSWTGSGLAWEGLPLWLTYWSGAGDPQEELRVGISDPRPSIPDELFPAALAGDGIAVRRFDLAEAHYISVTALPDGAALSIVVPPRRRLAAASPLGPLFGPARGEPDPLVLIPLLPGEVPGETEGIRWIPSRDGWQGELYLVYPDEVYHGHYLLEVPGPLLLAARGTLLLLLNLAVLTLLWGAGGWLGEGRPGRLRVLADTLGSFRGRVTLALFAFFLLPSIAFGTLAYQTLSGAAVRTAEALAERAAEDAATSYFEMGDEMELLARRVGSDLLLFEEGELVAGSSRELLELGLYEGWLPPEVHREMATGEDLMVTTTATLGGWEYVLAFRRVPGGRVLGAPAPLQAGATALRQREVADLIGFAVVLGGALSILLALLVGRALARPIQTLQVASERVGAGNMGVQLPTDRSDEFGAVFAAFNRMVDRLRRTRRELIRSSRRTRAIVEEVATGVIALDPQGRVTLVNPRAEGLLGRAIRVNEPLGLDGTGDGEQGPDDFMEWVEGYFRDGLREAGTDFSLGERRIRVRARRISRKGPLGGAVFSLEDVTDELRSERILAWGEMAQQVAHEVKNPLTPIKLGVQHIRRAWEDQSPDFERILSRNVRAILSEIERLAAIATSFSRYAAPTPTGELPLEPVEVAEALGDVMDLYAASEGPVAFSLDVAPELPPARARVGEVKEVLVNLLENARAALPSGGKVEVGVYAAPGSDGVELRVADNGPGIPDELLARIFEPHFSTRSTGTGLGLAIVRRLVTSWGGRVWAESRDDAGTTVRVVIPTWEGGGGEGEDV